MKLPELRIGSMTTAIPIVQGGMGVRVSRASLAAAVANIMENLNGETG